MKLQLRLIIGLMLLALGVTMGMEAIAGFLPAMAFPINIIVAIVLCIAALYLMSGKKLY